MAINISNITNVDTISGAGNYVSSVTSGSFFGILLIGIFFILVINMRRNGIENAIAGASFAILTISVFLVYLGWLSIIYPVISTMILAGTLFFIRFKER